MLNPGQVIEFSRKKQFKFIKPLGSGGTGDTNLFNDETTDMLFAVKKYTPKDINYIDEFYERFVDEIKILFKISHGNIVRVYNYYLYPEAKTGYLQMEYVEGCAINEFEPFLWSKEWHEIFIETIDAFKYLEENGILHRDIRPSNILIDKDETVKVIDFGFGKMLTGQDPVANSILLNWPVTELPEETNTHGIYNHQTEIYFVGKLFNRLFIDKNIEDFKFNHIVDKMIKSNPNQRYKTFNEVSKAISEDILSDVDFTDEQKGMYITFAEQLSGHINYYSNKYSPIYDASRTIRLLAELIRDSSLEDYIQANTRLIQCFIEAGYNYRNQNDIEVDCVRRFYNLLIGLSPSKQKIVLDNIYTRLSTIRVVSEEEIPF